jgi:hypothetical protein
MPLEALILSFFPLTPASKQSNLDFNFFTNSLNLCVCRHYKRKKKTFTKENSKTSLMDRFSFQTQLND